MPSALPKTKKYDPVKTLKKISRDSDPHKGSRRGGFHGTPKGNKGYTRKEKHPGQPHSEALTPEDETYRELMFPIADVLSWDIPAEGRPCGEGEDPKRGKCNPNLPPDRPGETARDMVERPDPYGPIPGPGEKPGRYDIGPDEYRNDPAEWERQIDKPYSQEPIPHPNDVGVDPAFRGGHGPLTGPQIDDINELDDNLDSSRSLVDTAKRMGLHDENSDALMRQWQQENPEADDQQTLVVMRDHYEKKIKRPGYEGGGTPVKDTPGFPPTKDPNRGMPWGASMADTVAELNWSTHKSETFNDTGEKGLHPAWGLKSIIDRGVKPHEKPGADKRIGEAEHQTTQRDIPSKKFKSYSMVHAFNWILTDYGEEEWVRTRYRVQSGDLPFSGAAPPFGSKDEDDVAEGKEIKTEHSGPKKGKGAWDKKKVAKKTSNKARRQAGKKAAQGF